MTQAETLSKFTTINYNKGFQMTFDNGWSISVQWGTAQSLTVGRLQRTISDHLVTPIHSSPDAEIMIWREEFGGVVQEYNFGHDSVKGYCNSDEVAEWIWKVANFPRQ